MSDSPLEGFMDLLHVQVDAFAVCEIARTASLRCDAADKIVVHLVLRGEGVVQWDEGSCPLRQGSVIIVPRGLPKLISGAGPIARVFEAREHCPLEHGLIKFRATTDHADLLLACAVVDVTIDGVVDIFAHLWEPMAEHATGPGFTPLLQLVEAELASLGLGSRAIVSALMKQILIAVFREQLDREAYRSWLWPAMLNPKLSKAALAMMKDPKNPHTVQSLAGIAGMSRSQFTEHFTSAFGRSPIEFLQAVRLKGAQRLLLSSSLPVKAVAAAVGYSSRSHFSRSFQARYGTDPSTFRQRSLAEPK